MSQIEKGTVNKSITIEEFNKLPENIQFTYELINDDIYMSSRPNGRHQKIMSNLHYIIRHYLTLKVKPCEIFTEVELEINNNVVIPDISVFCNLDTVDVSFI